MPSILSNSNTNSYTVSYTPLILGGSIILPLLLSPSWALVIDPFLDSVAKALDGGKDKKADDGSEEAEELRAIGLINSFLGQ